MTYKVVNLEDGMPTVEEARERLLLSLERAKKEGIKAFKLIHGYGSTGVGGKLRVAIRKSLARREKEGKINCFVPGEDWDIFERRSQTILQYCADLRKDADLSKGNPGITIVLI